MATAYDNCSDDALLWFIDASESGTRPVGILEQLACYSEQWSVSVLESTKWERIVNLLNP